MCLCVWECVWETAELIPAAMGALFNECYCRLFSTPLFIMQWKMILSCWEGSEMVYKLYFPLGWFQARVFQTAVNFLSYTSLSSFLWLFFPAYQLSPPFFCFCVSVSSHLWIWASLKGWNVLVNSCCSIWRHNNNSHLTNMEWEHQSETKHSTPQVMGHFQVLHVGSRRLTDTRHHCSCLCYEVPQ